MFEQNLVTLEQIIQQSRRKQFLDRVPITNKLTSFLANEIIQPDLRLVGNAVSYLSQWLQAGTCARGVQVQKASEYHGHGGTQGFPLGPGQFPKHSNTTKISMIEIAPKLILNAPGTNFKGALLGVIYRKHVERCKVADDVVDLGMKGKSIKKC